MFQLTQCFNRPIIYYFRKQTFTHCHRLPIPTWSVHGKFEYCITALKRRTTYKIERAFGQLMSFSPGRRLAYAIQTALPNQRFGPALGVFRAPDA